jgi:hypothetical protein
MTWNCCAARPVYKDEIRLSLGAQAALRKEWDRLRLIDTWREDLVEIHVGMVFQICVEKDSEIETPEYQRE